MTADKGAASTFESVEVDLKDRFIATVIAWLLPGAGHFYQGRHGKAILFMTCILGLFIFGMTTGGGKVVYASLNTEGRKLAMICQAGVGALVFPAWLQMVHVEILHKQEPLLQGFMAPPRNFNPSSRDELAEWHYDFHFKYEVGTLFTMIAGLLNILAVYDAAYGPVFVTPHSTKMEPSSDNDWLQEV